MRVTQGINKADRGHDAIRFQSRADLKAEFEISDCGNATANQGTTKDCGSEPVGFSVIC